MKKSEKTKDKIFFSAVLLSLIVIIIFGISKLGGDDETETAKADTPSQTTVTTVTTAVITTTVTTTTEPPLDIGLVDNDLYSEAAILLDSNGNTIFSFDENDRIYPASLTKIMTAIVAIENIDNLDSTISIPGDIFDYIYAQQASTAGFSAYETVSYRALLHGTLLSSGADCSLALAVYIAGSEDMFVRMMNQKAQELGMENTNFTNVCGLHNYEHYSTVSDISKLLSYSLENSQFKEIFTTPSYFTTTDYQPNGVTLHSTMFSQMSDSTFNGGKFLGGKTGFTSEAGLCLASLAEVNGKEYTLVTVGAYGDHSTEPFNIYDARRVYEAVASADNSTY